MRGKIGELIRGDSVKARSMRSSAFVVVGFGGQNVLRLGSNLILTRLLYPEAFGLMALVQVFLTGLQMFSDLGINASIIQNKRGEEPEFLNTAWTVQILRGVLLWAIACTLAWPAAQLYHEPRLMELMPVAALTAVITGFTTTKIAVANRNLQIGVQVMTELAAQFAGLIVTVVLTFIWRDVWALVIGGVCAAVFKVSAQHVMLKGPANRFHWDKPAAQELIRFGKFIFLSSIAGFIVNQSDRAILGAHIPLGDLGIYTIAYTVASIPLLLAQQAGGKVIFPLYRRFPMDQSAENRRKVHRARRLTRLFTLCLACAISLGGVGLIGVMYDERYIKAGPIVVLMGFSMAAQISVSMYDGAYLSKGDSRNHFFLTSLSAALQLVFLLVGVAWFGLLGAIFAPVGVVLCVYPFRAKLLRRYQAWDPIGDIGALALGWAITALATWYWWGSVGPFIRQVLAAAGWAIAA
ncbi:oligosaccharide flippase family protein (plasmid) [Thioclava litoralis]|uniref:Oligosaccharide flippase family protein n=1 Tax=Thioclava litoralis TaxID=3076557 RepID=A0ABZ1E3K6_9RHOB|nr:oligosaccharide flippase family protein [Thioclava sp. FTW29]